MYAGEVNISQEQLPAFLKTADRLKVRKYLLIYFYHIYLLEERQLK
jgi:hypothetical protein